MCAGAAVCSRVSTRSMFGSPDPKSGALGSLYHLGADPRLNHELTVVQGVRGEACAELLRTFFASRRTPARLVAA